MVTRKRQRRCRGFRANTMKDQDRTPEHLERSRHSLPTRNFRAPHGYTDPHFVATIPVGAPSAQDPFILPFKICGPFSRPIGGLCECAEVVLTARQF